MDFADHYGWTSICVADGKGHTEAVLELLNHGTSVHIAYHYDWKTLRVAAGKGHVDVVQELLNHGASVDLADEV